mgnify:CR=1 FL=1
MDRNMKKWHSYKLSDVVRFNPSERLLKGEIAKKVPMDLLQPYTRGISGFEMASYTGGSKFRNGDTLMARITPCLENGKTAYVSMLDEDEVGFGSTEYIVFRNIEGITDNKFVYYFVTSPWFRDIAVKSMVGSSGRQRVQQAMLENLVVNLPPLAEQKQIAGILGALDDKIELNRCINDNLEEQAKALFKSWFVDNNGEKWRKGIVSDFYDISIGKTPPRKESQWFTDSENGIVWASISDMGSCNVFLGNSSEYLTKEAVRKFKVCVVPENTILLSFKLTIGRVAIADKEMATNEAIAHFIAPNNAIEYTYLALKNYEFSSLGSTSSIATAINSKIIKSMPWMMPDEDTLNLFHQIVLPVFERMRNNCQEIICLSSLRDTLLPKLMSGEISVEEVSLD